MVFLLDFEDMNFMKCFLSGLVEDFIDDINFISVRMLLWIKVFDTRISFPSCLAARAYRPARKFLVLA